MTTSELLRLVLRRWYVMVLGAAVSVAILYGATHQPAVYWTQFNVVLLAPNNVDYPNYLKDPRFQLQPMVGVVVRDIHRNDTPVQTASADATLVGVGVHRGVQVRAPNFGSQWKPDFSANHLDVQVADDRAEAVAIRAEQVTEEISRVLDRRQDALGIAPDMRITAFASTGDPTIYQVSGSKVRAAAGVALAGATGTTIVVYWLEVWLTRRRRTRTPAVAR